MHYYVPRAALIDEATRALVGENPARGGHYITVWAHRSKYEAVSADEEAEVDVVPIFVETLA